MTFAQMHKFQREAIKTMAHKGLELRTQLLLAKDIALWEQAIQLATLNETLKRFERKVRK